MVSAVRAVCETPAYPVKSGLTTAAGSERAALPRGRFLLESARRVPNFQKALPLHPTSNTEGSSGACVKLVIAAQPLFLSRI